MYLIVITADLLASALQFKGQELILPLKRVLKNYYRAHMHTPNINKA